MLIWHFTVDFSALRGIRILKIVAGGQQDSNRVVK